MNSKQRKKARKASKMLIDICTMRLKMKGELEADVLAAGYKNFLLQKPAPHGSYWNKLTGSARRTGYKAIAKGIWEKRKNGI